MTERWQAGPDDLVTPFLFVPRGDPDPVAWKAAHPGWVSFPATMVPRAASGAVADPGEPKRPARPPGPRERQPGEPSTEFPEFDPVAHQAMMAVFDDPVGTLRRLGYPLAPQAVATPARTPPDESAQAPHANPQNIDRFFDDLDAPLANSSSRLSIDSDWLEGLAAHESGWFDTHNRRLNNPLGLTHAGGNNVRFPSVDEAADYWVRQYGDQVRGAKSPADFVERLEGRRDGSPVAGWHVYNSVDPSWANQVKAAIASIPRRRRNWLLDRGSAVGR